MRHNPAAGAVVIMLRALKMHGMAQAVGELTEQGSPAFEAALPILSQLLKAETADREVRSTAYQLKAARFPNYRDLAGFDFASSEVNEALVRQLHRCEFLEDAHNVVLVGGPGTGKTHLATAIGVQAIEHHRKRVRFFSTVELVNALEQEKLQGKAGPDRWAARLFRPRHPRRAWLPAVQRLRRSAALPSAQQALRANQRHHHDEPELRRMGDRVRRTRRFHDASLFDRLVRRTLALSTTAWSGDSEICQGIPLASCVPVSHPFRSQSNMTCGVMPMAAAAPWTE